MFPRKIPDSIPNSLPLSVPNDDVFESADNRSIYGILYDESYEPFQGAEVVANQDDLYIYTAVTAIDGSFEFPAEITHGVYNIEYVGTPVVENVDYEGTPIDVGIVQYQGKA